MAYLESMAYPDADYPWTFYFNAVPLPKWSQCWPAEAVEIARAEIATWDERITAQDLHLLYCRIDHAGVIESEDPLRFQVLALGLLQALLDHKDDIIASLSPEPVRSLDAAAARYALIVEGLTQMIERAAAEQMAVWTVGYEADRQALMEAMRRFQLPSDHPEYAAPPHVQRDRQEAHTRLGFVRKDLLHSPAYQGAPKSLRRLLQGMRASGS